MGYIGHAFVDWDDTIAENIRYFHETEATSAGLIARATGADPEAVRRRGQELDLATARRLGLVRESLSTAWLECYREFCAGAGLGPDRAVERTIFEACQFPYETRQDLLPGAAETLAWLYDSGFEVTIWTAGDSAVQRRKIRESGLSRLVHREVVVVDKTPERLRAALEERETSRCFVAGNSMHSDIRPALALGVLALHIPVETWAYDQARVDLSDSNYHRVEGITDLPRALARRFPALGEVG